MTLPTATCPVEQLMSTSRGPPLYLPSLRSPDRPLRPASQLTIHFSPGGGAARTEDGWAVRGVVHKLPFSRRRSVRTSHV